MSELKSSMWGLIAVIFCLAVCSQRATAVTSNDNIILLGQKPAPLKLDMGTFTRPADRRKSSTWQITVRNTSDVGRKIRIRLACNACMHLESFVPEVKAGADAVITLRLLTGKMVGPQETDVYILDESSGAAYTITVSWREEQTVSLPQEVSILVKRGEKDFRQEISFIARQKDFWNSAVVKLTSPSEVKMVEQRITLYGLEAAQFTALVTGPVEAIGAEDKAAARIVVEHKTLGIREEIPLKCVVFSDIDVSPARLYFPSASEVRRTVNFYVTDKVRNIVLDGKNVTAADIDWKQLPSYVQLHIFIPNTGNLDASRVRRNLQEGELVFDMSLENGTHHKFRIPYYAIRAAPGTDPQANSIAK